jgi:hypothetical protein
MEKLLNRFDKILIFLKRINIEPIKWFEKEANFILVCNSNYLKIGNLIEIFF